MELLDAITIDDHYFPITAAICIMLVEIYSGVMCVWALRVIYKQTQLTRLVKLYFYGEYVAHIVPTIIHIFWALPNIFWDWAATQNYLNNIIGLLFYSSYLSYVFAQAALSANRFFAIFFDGFYYDYVRTQPRLQVFVVVGVLPIILGSPVLFPGCQAVWLNDGSYSFVLENTEHANQYAFYVQTLLPAIILCIQIVLDATFLVKLRRRLVRTKSDTALNINIRLSVQMACNHLCTLFGIIAYVSTIFIPYPPFMMFVVFTLFAQATHGTYGLILVLILGRRFTKKKIHHRTSIMPSGTQEHTVTRLPKIQLH